MKCVKVKLNSSNDREATSRYCPILIREQTKIQKRTNYSHEKKYSSIVSPEVAFWVSLPNAYSINNKACHTHDLIVDSKLDVMFLTETWQTSDISPAFKAATPTTHHYYHVTRPGWEPAQVALVVTVA